MATKGISGPLIAVLHRAWEDIGQYLLRDQGGEEASGEEVRKFIHEFMDMEPPLNARVRKYWRPLSPEKKEQLLAVAFPDGVYKRR